MGYPHKFKRPTEHRFFKYIDQSSNCWEWTGALNGENGYGMFYDGDKRIYAHRFSYITHVNDIPNNLVVMHSCDNRKCVNPDHLSVGTHVENMQDMVRKGRAANGGVNSHLKGKIKLICKNGHDISSPTSVYVNKNNPSSGRICRICNNANKLRWLEEKNRKRGNHEEVSKKSY